MKPLRIVFVLHLLAVVTQAVLAGQFLSGADGLVVVHESTGWAVVALGLVQVILAVVVRARVAIILPSALIFLGEVLQVGTGYLRFLGVHVPLGVLIAGGLAALAAWMFRS